MDRRDFMKTTGTVATAVAAAVILPMAEVNYDKLKEDIEAMFKGVTTDSSDHEHTTMFFARTPEEMIDAVKNSNHTLFDRPEHSMMTWVQEPKAYEHQTGISMTLSWG